LNQKVFVRFKLPVLFRCIGVAALHTALSKQKYGLDPRMHRLMVPWSSGDDAWLTSRERWFDSIRDHSTVCRCCGSTPPWYGGRPGSTPGWTSATIQECAPGRAVSLQN